MDAFDPRKINNLWQEISEEEKKAVQDIVSFYYYRDAAQNIDGSWGSIKITPTQLRNLVAHLLRNQAA